MDFCCFLSFFEVVGWSTRMIEFLTVGLGRGSLLVAALLGAGVGRSDVLVVKECEWLHSGRRGKTAKRITGRGEDGG